MRRTWKLKKYIFLYTILVRFKAAVIAYHINKTNINGLIVIDFFLPVGVLLRTDGAFGADSNRRLTSAAGGKLWNSRREASVKNLNT